MVTGLARAEFFLCGQGAFVAYLAEGPDGAVSLPETVIFRVHVRYQCLDSVTGVLLCRLGADLFDARSDRKANAHERGEE